MVTINAKEHWQRSWLPVVPAPDGGTALNPIRANARFRDRRSRWSVKNIGASCANVGMKESKVRE